MNQAIGGKNIYGFKIGILMLESKFPRIPGELGNATTFPFPVLYKIVKGASPRKIVSHITDEDLLPFVEAAKELEAEGVSAITTSCGFLGIFHEKISSHLHVPFFSSSLIQIPVVYHMLPPGKIVGILTIDSTSLTDDHLRGAGVLQIPHVIYGLETEKEFTGSILANRLNLDIEKCRIEHRNVAKRMVTEHPEVGAIVLECTNMPPYAKDIQEVTGLPVFDICTLIRYVYSSLVKPDISGYL